MCVCLFTSEAGGLGDWAGSLHGLRTDPAGKDKFNLCEYNIIMTKQDPINTNI